MVEPNEDVRDEKAALRETGSGVRERHGRLEVRRVVVREVPHDRLPAGLGLREGADACPRPDERMAAEPPALHRLEQERGGADPAQAEVRTEGRDQVGGDVACRVHADEKTSGRRSGRAERAVRQSQSRRRLPPRSQRQDHQVRVAGVIRALRVGIAQREVKPRPETPWYARIVPRSVIVSAVRTPFGKLGGGLAHYEATALGAIAIRASLERIGLEPHEVEYVIMGQVLQGGAGQAPARQASIGAGLPIEVGSDTINKVCASSIRAVEVADQMIRAGDHEVVVAGGMESMTNAPYALKKARFGYRLGDGTLIDLMTHDGLVSTFDQPASNLRTKRGYRIGRERTLQRLRQRALLLSSLASFTLTHGAT